MGNSVHRLTLILGASVMLGCGREAELPDAQADSSRASGGAEALPAGELAYVTNEDSQELTVIDTRSDSVVATIPVGTRPRGVRVAPDGKTVFVALSGSPKCPPTMPDEECEKLKADKSKDGVAVVDVATQKGDAGAARADPIPKPSTSARTALRCSCPTRMPTAHPS